MSNNIDKFPHEDQEKEDHTNLTPTARLMEIVSRLREETEPVRVEIKEPIVSQEAYNKIRQLQKEHAELYQMGMYKQAYDCSMKVLDVCLENYGTLHPVTLSAMNNVAIALKGNGETIEAKNIMVNVFEGYVKLFGQKHKHSLLVFHNLAKAYQQNKEYDIAIKLFDEMIPLIESLEEPENNLLILSKANMAICLRELKRDGESMQLFKEALANIERFFGDHETLLKAFVLLSMGLTSKKLGKTFEAENLYQEALRIRRSFYPEDHPEVMVCYHNLSVLYEEAGDLKKSEEMLQLSKSILEKVVKKDK